MPRLTWVCVLGLFLNSVVASSASAENWPQFRGPAGTGHSETKGLPLHWSATEHVAWKQEIPGGGWSSPIYVDGRLYLTTAVPTKGEDTKDRSLRALCLDAATGELVWNAEVFEQVAENTDNIHTKNSHASPTPILDGDRLYVHYGTKGTACLDRTGNIVWRNQSIKYTPVHGNGGSPVLTDGRLIFSCDGGNTQLVIALDAATGDISWKASRDNGAPKKFAFTTPLVLNQDGRNQVISPGAYSVNSYDAVTGEEIWKVNYVGYSVIPRPVAGHGLVYICTGYDRPSLLAVKLGGKGDITDTHIEWSLTKAVPNSPSLTLLGDELYLMSDNGIATCLDAKTGSQHWQERIGGSYSASPIDAEGRIYFQSEQGDGIVIQAGTEFRELARNPLGERTLASYAVGEGCLFIRSDKHLYCIRAN